MSLGIVLQHPSRNTQTSSNQANNQTLTLICPSSPPTPAMAFDRGSVTTTQVFSRNTDQDDTKLQVQRDLESFVMSFRIHNRYVYRLVGPLQNKTKQNIDLL